MPTTIPAMQRKELKVTDLTKEGEVAAIVATLEVWDSDGDWTEPGYFGKQHTSIVRGHNWADLQLGKGILTDEDPPNAMFQGKFNLDVPEAEQLHAKLLFDRANPPPLIEWSYGMLFNEGGTAKGTRDGREGRILQPLPDGSPGARIPEVSPVMVGAGEGTGTVAVKASMRLVDHITATRTDVQALSARVAEVVAARREKGQELGKASKAALDELIEELENLRTTEVGLEDPDPDDQAPVLTIDHLAILEATEARLRGL